ncbi:family A G protein-coupled receptor-like protein [Whalleya microplaca]|nr:family A G protein-coupled receptor-like protein [Whalleya microplaca]
MMEGGLSDSQLEAISIIERVGSVFSLIGCLFIIGSFAISNAFHKPINRLVFYASFGNMMTNIGTLMARHFVDDINTFGCQFQAFLIQMFMPADAYWTLAMAVNVYLTFYFKFDATKLRKMEVWYFLICYGAPFIPAITYVFLYKEAEGRFYGNAILWCWISPGWDAFRIITFYGPVMVAILATFFIYIRAGRDIYNKRKQLRNFGASSSGHDPEPLTMDDPHSVKTTEVKVTSESAEEIDLGILGRVSPQFATPKQAYTVTISSSKRNGESQQVPVEDESRPKTARGMTQKRRANFEANNATWSYSKCAILFFTALLVTWIPSSANRMYSVANRNKSSVTLEVMSALVLPLQGFWNTLIYVATSWEAVKKLFGRGRDTSHYVGDNNNKTKLSIMLTNRKTQRRNHETESMAELATQEVWPNPDDESKDSKGGTSV